MPVPAEAHRPRGKCLHSKHAGQPPVGDAYGLQSAELLQFSSVNK